MDMHGSLILLAGLGLFVGALLLLNLRDRREAALSETMWCLAPHDLVALIAIDVRCALLWPTSVARVDLWAAGRNEVWRPLALWREGLPPFVRLQVTACLNEATAATVTLETRGVARGSGLRLRPARRRVAV